jgi:hypothetical protein
MRQLSRAPEGHWSRTPGSPLAERWFQEFRLNCRVLPEQSEGRTPEISGAGNNHGIKNKKRLSRVRWSDSLCASFVYISSMANFNNYNTQFPVGN